MATRVERLVFALSTSEAKLVAGIKKAAKAIRSFGSESKSSTDAVGEAFGKLDSRIEASAGRIVNGIFSIQSALATLAAGAGAAAPIKFAQEFETALANVDTLLKDAIVTVDQYESQLLTLAQQSSKELIDLTDGLYQTISAGIPAIEGTGGAFDVLTAAQRAAVAGLATTEQAVDTFTTILNAYAKTGITAAEVSDKLFTTIAAGKTTFPELGSAIGRVATVAAQFNISIDEVLAALISLTKRGLSTDEAVTALRATILGLAKPMDRSRKLFEELGIPIGEAAFKSKGLQGVLAQISTTTGDSADALVELIPNIRAIVGSMALGTDGAGEFAASIDQLRNATGATDAAYEKIARTFGDTAAIFGSQVNAVLIAAGNRVLPRVQAALKTLGDFIVENQDRIGEAFERFISLLFAIGDFVAQNGTTLIAFVTAFFATQKIAAATQALLGFVAAFQRTLALSAAGQAAGGAFMTGFQKAVRALPSALSAMLRSPSALGLFVGVAVIIGKLIGDSITAEAEKAIDDAKAELKRLQKEADDLARERGFANSEEQLEAAKARSRGRLLLVGDNSDPNNIRRENLLGATDALQRFVDEGSSLEEAAATLRKEAAEEIAGLNELYNTAEARAKEISKLEDTQRRQRRSLDPTSDEARRLNTLISGSVTQLRLLREQQAELKASAQTIVDTTESAIEDAQFELANEELQERARKRALDKADAARRGVEAERERLRLLEAADAAEARLAKTRIGRSEAEFEARRAQIDAIATLSMQRLEAQHRSELQLLEARKLSEEVSDEEIAAFKRRQADEIDAQIKREAEARIDLIREEQDEIDAVLQARIDAINAASEQEREQAKATTAQVRKEFKAGTKERLELEEALTRRLVALRKQAAEEVVQAELEARREAAEKEREAAEEEAKRRAAEERQAQREAQAAADAATRSAAGRFVEVAEKVGEILDDAIEALEDGIVAAFSAGASFLQDALISPFTGVIGRALSSLTVALPEQQKDRFGIEASPVGQLESIVRQLPEILAQAASKIGSLIGPILRGTVNLVLDALTGIGEQLPEIARAVGRALDDAIPKLIRGLVDAVKSLIDGLVQLLEDLLRNLPSFLMELIPDLIDAIEEILASLIDGIASLLPDLVDAIIRIVTNLIEEIPDLVGVIVRSVVRAIVEIVQQLPAIISRIFDLLPELIASIIDLIPELVTELIAGLVPLVTQIIEALPDILYALVAEVIPGLIEAVVGAIGRLLTDSLPALIGALIEVIPELIGALIALIPRLVIALIAGIGQLLENLWDSIKNFSLGDFLGALGDIWSEIGQMIIDGIVDALKELGENVGGDGGFFDALTGDKPKNTGGEIGAFLGRTTGISAIGKLFRGEDLGAEDIPIIGGIIGLFHKGGTVPSRMRNPAQALAMRLAGAPAFASGGMVQRLNAGVRQRLGAMMTDDVPAVLQAGEGVVSRRGMAALGGSVGLDSLNNGQPLWLNQELPTGGQGGQLVIVANDGATEELLRKFIKGWSIQARTAGSDVRTVLDREDPYFGAKRGRGRT